MAIETNKKNAVKNAIRVYHRKGFNEQQVIETVYSMFRGQATKDFVKQQYCYIVKNSV